LSARANDTSLNEVEKTYSAFITDFADQLSRSALLDCGVPAPTGNVVPLARG
jgi:hypothetical protein